MGRKSKRNSNPRPGEKSTKKNQGESSLESQYEKLVEPQTSEKSHQFKLTRIVDRLALSLFEEEDDYENEYDGQELRLLFRTRRYFSCCLCLICGDKCEDIKYRCEECKMVFYCSKRHRTENYEEHKEICLVLTDICIKVFEHAYTYIDIILEKY